MHISTVIIVAKHRQKKTGVILHGQHRYKQIPRIFLTLTYKLPLALARKTTSSNKSEHMMTWIHSETNLTDIQSKLHLAPVKPKTKINTQWQKEAKEITNGQADNGRVCQPQLLTTAEAAFKEVVRTTCGVYLEDLWPCLKDNTHETPKREEQKR